MKYKVTTYYPMTKVVEADNQEEARQLAMEDNAEWQHDTGRMSYHEDEVEEVNVNN